MFNYSKNSYGFTLAEILIVLVVIGVVFAITALNITGIISDNNTSRFKKSYLSMENAISYLVSNEAIYGTSGGFKDTDSVIIKKVGEILGQDPSSKFRDSFRYYIGAVKDNIPCSLYGGATSRTGCFQTDDGIVWGIPDTDFIRKNMVTVKDHEEYDIQVLPITIYLDYQNEQAFEKSAYVAAVTYDGRIMIPQELNKAGDCTEYSRAPQCNIEKYIKASTIKSDNADE